MSPQNAALFFRAFSVVDIVPHLLCIITVVARALLPAHVGLRPLRHSHTSTPTHIVTTPLLSLPCFFDGSSATCRVCFYATRVVWVCLLACLLGDPVGGPFRFSALRCSMITSILTRIDTETSSQHSFPSLLCLSCGSSASRVFVLVRVEAE